MARAAAYRSDSSEAVRVVFALMLREIKTRFGESHLGFVWLFLEPLLFVVPVILFWRTTRGSMDHGLPLVEFLLTGYAPFVMWRHCVSRSVTAISANAGLLYHKTINPERIIVARCLLEIAGSFVSIGSIYIVFYMIGLVRMPHYMSYFLLGWLYMALVSWAFGAVFAALSQVADIMEKIITTFSYLFLAIGGSFYMVEWLPKSVQAYVVWIPTVQAFEMIRYGYFGEVPHTHWSPLNMFVCALVLSVLGLQLLKVARTHIEVE